MDRYDTPFVCRDLDWLWCGSCDIDLDKNPNKGVAWKTFQSLKMVTQGAISFATMKEWLE